MTDSEEDRKVQGLTNDAALARGDRRDEMVVRGIVKLVESKALRCFIQAHARSGAASE